MLENWKWNFQFAVIKPDWMNNKYAMSADKAGFYDSGQDVYEKSDNGAWISSELRQTV